MAEISVMRMDVMVEKTITFDCLERQVHCELQMAMIDPLPLSGALWSDLSDLRNAVFRIPKRGKLQTGDLV